ncbi:polyphosphate polymerase domain-containing protein [Actinotalea sp. K2]|uniref:polyphosphate polymerase domain-containing protein n=1 Tax=Actinotalea sp. K2 TaxID=2939438 RepID=UPI002017E86E|nr:polyphosphate polymerase domain-containing protein [Actinotalea sp. K2]MCL3861016.1 polyphosphate polymerase domain-containing protein [Actinotalea sp. K2]
MSDPATALTRNVIPTPWAALPAIGLDELTERASLLTRVDRKYLVPTAELTDLVGGLADDGAQVLEIDGSRTFAYASVYFDTSDLTSYLLAARRRRRRFKVRTRTYLDSSQCWLEVKTRDLRGRTVKHRCAHDLADQASLTPRGAAFADDVLAGASVTGTEAATLLPTLVTRYDRSTLHLPSTGSRVTVDTGLRCTAPDGRVVDLRDLAVVETKTTGSASSADRLLWRSGHRPVAFSKYATGLAALTPDLPAARWHRVLSNHLQPAAP